MTVFYFSLSIYFFLIVAWAVFVEPYKQLLPIEKIKKGYLNWSENFRFQRNNLLLFVHVKGLVRYWITGPIKFDNVYKNVIKKVNEQLIDLEQTDPHKYHFLIRKVNKIN